LSAEIIRLCDRRLEADADLEIDLRTAVDVAIRDLQEIEAHWGTESALDRSSGVPGDAAESARSLVTETSPVFARLLRSLLL
jgi:hypothetical protein